jgi:hypothetical protein
MAKVQGVKEKLHSPIYDAFFVKDKPNNGPRKTFTTCRASTATCGRMA